MPELPENYIQVLSNRGEQEDSMKPSQLTLDECRKRGMEMGIVERYNSFVHKRFDFVGLGDIIAFSKYDGIYMIQATSGSNHSSHRDKIFKDEKLKKSLLKWLESGGRFGIWSWSKKGDRGKRKLWTLREDEITCNDIKNGD